MLTVQQCFKKTYGWRKARSAQGVGEGNVDHMNANVTDIPVPLPYAFLLLLTFQHLPSSQIHAWVRGKSCLPPLSDEPLHSLHLPLLICFVPHPNFWLQSYHSSKESSVWKQGHPCLKALKSDSIQPTQARFRT